ncbi:MAG TPA: formate dehydrogenase subunit alpha [Pyrinomonadaceae bacterium]|nr:formate dehydrogenase subunit alpha [Pyrinomonadaceae bacterium]
MVKTKINGVEHQFDKETTILEASKSVGIYVPTLCNDKRLKPCGACRLCIVEVKGQDRPVASCMTEIKEGMEIEIHTPELEKAREFNLKMLAHNYPFSAFEQHPDKHFHKLAEDYHLTKEDFLNDKTNLKTDTTHPYIEVDMSRCIHCNRCVRICEQVQGRFVWQVVNRGAQTVIVPDASPQLKDSSCVSCGACVDTCPTGALEDKSVIKFGEPTNWTKTVCPYCGTGCEMNVGTKNDQIVQIKPAQDAPVNHGHLCVKGRYAFGFVDSKDRVTEPLIREKGEWRTVSWDEALQFTANKLKKIVAENGKQAIGVLGSARATNEENYLAQKFARVCLENNNVDCCARVCHTPSAAAIKTMLGTGAATNSFNDVEFANAIMICGANPTENHPIVGERIRQAALRKKAKLIVIDPRKTELTKHAEVHLQIRPGTNVLIFNSIANVIVEEGLFDPNFVAERVSEFEEYREFIKDFSPEKVAKLCGVSAADMRKAARIYANAKPAMTVHGLGMTEHFQGTEGVMCIVNLALLTGNLGKRGAGVNPLRGQNNVQGSAQMGCDPANLTGSISLDAGRALFESVWNAPVPHEKGLNLLQMMDSAAVGELKALWTIGYDIYLTNADAHDTEKALRSMELVIVQDMFMNETAREFAHVFLPAASSYEKDGTFMNGERRVQRIRQAVSPRGNSKSDWEIICELAKAMGSGEHFAFNSPEEIWNEIRAVWKASYGITYERLDKQGLQWNCFDENDNGTEVLHTEEFPLGKRAALKRIPFAPTEEIVTDDFPFLLTTGRTLFHFNAGTMTQRTNNAKLRPTDLLEINPFDAEKLSFKDGEIVNLQSKYGEAKIPVHINDKVKKGELYATFHNTEIFLNNVTSPHRDRLVNTPEYKITAVRVDKID